MSKFTRRLSLFTALVMVLGLFTAFPALGAVRVNAEDPVNVAEGKMYKYSVAPFSSYSDGGTANEYHTGFLTDGAPDEYEAGNRPPDAVNGYVGYINKLDDYTVIVDLGECCNISAASIDLYWHEETNAVQPTKLECAYSADENDWADSVGVDIKDSYTTRSVGHYSPSSGNTTYTRTAKTHNCDVAGEGMRYVKFTISTEKGKRLYIDEIKVWSMPAAAPPEESSEAPPEESSEAPPEESSEVPPEESSEAPPEESSEVPPEESSEAPPEESSEIPPEESSEAPPEESSEIPPEESSEEPPTGPVNVAEGKMYKYSVKASTYYPDSPTDAEADVYHIGHLTDGKYDGAEPGRAGACKDENNLEEYDGNSHYVGYIAKLSDYTVTVDLGAMYDISLVKMDIFWDADNPFGSSAQPTRLDCAYSANGENWVSETDIKGNYDARPVLHSKGSASTRTAKTHKCEVAVEGMRYVMFTISTGDPPRLYMDEIEVWGVPAEAPPEESSEAPPEESSEAPPEESSEVPPEESSQEEQPPEESSQEEQPPEESSQEEQPPVLPEGLVNVAREAEYKGSTNSGTNATGNFGDGKNEAGDNIWTEYHKCAVDDNGVTVSGKLIDGKIVTVPTNNKDKGTVEVCVGEANDVHSGSYQIVFKLAAESDIYSVKVFLNWRQSSYRGYPDRVEAFVGPSEDIAEAALLGVKNKDGYTVYEGSESAKLCEIATENPVKGKYVIVQFTIDEVVKEKTDPKANGMNGISEIEILGIVKYAVAVEGGTADMAEAAEGDTVTITATVPEYKKFVKWTGNVEFADANAASTTFVMPAEAAAVAAEFEWNLDTSRAGDYKCMADPDLRIRAIPLTGDVLGGINLGDIVHVDGVTSNNWGYLTYNGVTGFSSMDYLAKFYNVTVEGGAADVAEAAEGETVTITAGEPTEGQEFDKWEGNAEFTDASAAETTFAMPAEDVSVKATYKAAEAPPVTPTEPVNVAPTAEYKANPESGCNDISGSHKYAENPWCSYKGLNPEEHQGRLVDGKVEMNVPFEMYTVCEFCNNGAVYPENTQFSVNSGTSALMFKLAKAEDIKNVKIFLNNNNGGYRGYPDEIKAYVSNEDNFDVSGATLLGTVAQASFVAVEGSGNLKLAEVNGNAAVNGGYVIIQFIANSTSNGVVGCSEIEIWTGEGGEPEPPAKYAVAVEGGTADMAEAAEGETVTITAGDAPEGQEFDKWEGNAEFADANAASTTFVMPAEAVSVKATYKTEVKNIAPEAQYRASENCADNGDGDKGEPDWGLYHKGKLNDKVIATSFVDQNADCVEFWANNTSTAAPVPSFIYFKFSHERAIHGVHMYFNVREDKTAGQSNWPSLVKAYVGSSETEYTLLGDASAVYRKVNDTVWDYYADVDAAMTGSYVVLEIASNTTDWIALTEVEIMGEPYAGPYNIVVGPEGKANSNPSGTAYPGETVTLGALAGDPGMRFAGWSGDVDLLSDPAVCPIEFVMPARDVAFEAMYEWALDTSKAGKYRCTADPNLRIRKLPNTDQGTEVLGAIDLDAIVEVKGVVDTEASSNRYWGLLTYNGIEGFASMDYLERLYDITVEEGKADKEIAAAGETVTVTARAVPEGYSFKRWVGDNVRFNNPEAAETTFEMPEWNVNVKAEFTSTLPVNVAPNAEYRGDDIGTNSLGPYGEEGFWNINDTSHTNDNNVYHKGKLNDGEKPNDWSNKGAKGKNIEFGKSGWGVGPFRLYFKLAEETPVTQINAYAGMRDTGGNRAYPVPFNVYVGHSEDDVSDETLFGQADTVDEGIVRNYTVSGEKTGTYVIIDTEIPGGAAVITFCEIEIFGITDGPVVPPPAPAEPLATPVLKSSAPKMETYEIPTISWEAVPNATGYDVYLDGELVAEGITELSYVPAITTRSDYGGNTPEENNDHYRVQVVAKGDGTAYSDSEKSEEVAIMYVEKPVDSQGNPVTSADIILDAGHGGIDPGAIGFETRHEADDNLNMTIQVGRYFEEMGFTVAYTRISDISDTRRTKAAKGEAGDFKLYICIHRNAFSEERANGLEVLYPTGNSVDQAFAQVVCDELDALGLFTKRGVKTPKDDYHGTITNVSMPVILTELGFVTNAKDNTTFDEYFCNIAAAIVKGTMKYDGYATDFDGTLTVKGADHAISRAEHTVDAGTIAEGSALNYKFVGSHGLGFKYLQVKVDDGAWTTVEPLDAYLSDAELEHNKNGKLLSYEGSVEGLAVGEHTLTVRVGTLLDAVGSEHPTAEEELFVVKFNVWLLGDVNHDGEVDNLDASLVLQYDAELIGEDDLDLELADVDGDNKVDNIDAATILRYDADLIEGFKED